MLATFYDPLVWPLTAGRAGALRRATLDAAGLRTGDDVLDAGCGTGALTLAMRRTVGPSARVVGLDASAPMRARALRRASRAGVSVEVTAGEIRRLPFADGSFDAVLLSLVLHYLTPEQAAHAVAEARRVLRGNGRVVVVDFGRSHGLGDRLRAHLMLHGGVSAGALDLEVLLRTGGMSAVASSPSPVPALRIVHGTRHEH